jgi:hypothetical protein
VPLPPAPIIPIFTFSDGAAKAFQETTLAPVVAIKLRRFIINP